MSFANSRKVWPAEAWFVAQPAGTLHEDCGPSVQIGVNLAKQAGVDPEIIRATLDGNSDALSQELIDVYQFTRSVITAQADDDTLRNKLCQRYGERGLIELA